MSPRTSLAVFARDARSKSHSLAPSNYKEVLLKIGKTARDKTYRKRIGEQNVGGFDIAMGDAPSVEKVKSTGNRMDK